VPGIDVPIGLLFLKITRSRRFLPDCCPKGFIPLFAVFVTIICIRLYLSFALKKIHLYAINPNRKT
jgi:hypothetical protein